jgi:hypothetical protein
MKRQRPATHPFFNFRNPKWKYTHSLPRWYKKLAWAMLLLVVVALIWSVWPSGDDDEDQDAAVVVQVHIEGESK